jgi:hypothetical protein
LGKKKDAEELKVKKKKEHSNKRFITQIKTIIYL